jgi:AcrR family transcriptional regulator
MATPPRVRMSAEERRGQIIAAAIRHFALRGYHAASTESIAQDVGISQPYLFRLFRTKLELFLACHAVVHERISDAFRTAAEGVPKEERLEAMGHAYVELLQDRDLLLMQMQAYVAGSDPEIQAAARRCYGALAREVAELSGAGPDELWTFFANGMLLNVIAALDLGSGEGEEWAATHGEPPV